MRSSRGRWAGALSVAVLLAAQAAAAGVQHSPALGWHSLQTPHFRIHYHDGLKRVAQRAAAVAEAAHADLAPRFEWTPQRRTTIVLTDEVGRANGYASPFPRNRITIYTTPPDSPGTFADHRSWLQTVIRHEYVHILHTDKVGPELQTVRQIFGRVAFPGAFQPRWAIEGLAQKLEAPKGTRAGRAQDSVTAMYMRMETKGGIDPLDRVSHTAQSWPGGRRPYIYGVAFMNFLDARYGAEARRTWIRAQSREAIPFRYTPALQEATGKDMDALWLEFEAWLEAKHKPTLKARRKAGVRAGKAVTSGGALIGRPHADGPGYIVHTRQKRHGPPSLQRRNLETGKVRRLGEVRPGARLAVARNRPILVAQPAACDNARTYYDLYRFARSGGSERLSHCARYRQIAWGQKRHTAYALRQEAGRPALVRLRIRKGGVRAAKVLWEGKAFTTLDGLQLSPDGQRLLAGRWNRRHGWHIAEFDLGERSWHVVQARQAVEMQPRYADDGASILYTADYGGIYDIRRLNRNTGKVTRLTRVEGGAFAPTAVAREGGAGDLVFVNYRADGFDLHRRSLDAPTLASELPPRGASADMAELPETPPIEGPKPYTSLTAGLAPAFWSPMLVVGTDRAFGGAFTTGSDALKRHNYAVSAGYEFIEGMATGSLDYVYDRFFPVPKLSWESTLGYHSAAAQVMLPWVTSNRRFSLHVGGTLQRRRAGPFSSAAGTERSGQANPVGLAAVMDSTERWPLSVSVSHGRFATVALEHEDLVGNPAYSGPVAVADYRDYLSLKGSQVLHLRVAGGYGTDDPQPFQLGGFAPPPAPPGLTSFPSRTNPLNRRSFALRGYSASDERLEAPGVAMATTEYRFPIRRIERGVDFLPLAVRHLSGRVAVDAGKAWGGGATRELHVGAAAEGLAHLNFGYGGAAGVNFPLRLGVGHGFSGRGKTQLYLTLGAPF